MNSWNGLQRFSEARFWKLRFNDGGLNVLGKKHWAHLNDEGKKIYGLIFPDGIVPVKLMLPNLAKLGGQPQRMFKVDLTQLSEQQMNELLELIAQKFHAPKQAIKKQVEKDGFIPLRASLTSGSGTDQLGLFI